MAGLGSVPFVMPLPFNKLPDRMAQQQSITKGSSFSIFLSTKEYEGVTREDSVKRWTHDLLLPVLSGCRGTWAGQGTGVHADCILRMVGRWKILVDTVSRALTPHVRKSRGCGLGGVWGRISLPCQISPPRAPRVVVVAVPRTKALNPKPYRMLRRPHWSGRRVATAPLSSTRMLQAGWVVLGTFWGSGCRVCRVQHLGGGGELRT